MNQLYKQFEQEVIRLYELESERLKIDFDESKNYTKFDLSDLISYGERDIDKIQNWLKLISNELRTLWGSGDPKDQNEINKGYELVATKISERKGGPLKFEKEDVIKLSKKAQEFDQRCKDYCE